MSFAVDLCTSWYCLAYLQIGGWFEMSAPFGIFIAASALALLWKYPRDWLKFCVSLIALLILLTVFRRGFKDLLSKCDSAESP